MVQVAFDGYALPDKLEITTESGRLLMSTHVAVSGAQTMTFMHDPTAAGSTKVRLRVIGHSDSKTIWTVAASCPNQSLPLPPTVGVRFDADYQPGYICSLGICSLQCPGNWSFGTTGDLTGYFGYRNLVQGITYTYMAKWNPSRPTTGACSVPTPYIQFPNGRKQWLRDIGMNSVTVQQYGDGGGG
jgi:hypothetical protein